MTKDLGWAVAAGAVVAALIGAPSIAEKGATAEPPAANAAAGGPAKSPAPERVDKAAGEKPLLLLDEDAEVKPPAEGMADNSRCHVCHVNFAKEELAVTHARAKIGCAKCHGPSDAHIDDESWTWGGKGTPPDKMYLRAKVNAFCATCHEMSKAEAPKCPFPAMRDKKVCTECHGKHRLPQRKCKWK
jgi:hypothetical protein